MAGDNPRRFFHAEQMIGLILAGILMLSGLLYYRAVRAQRYLEPTLALAVPRISFTRRVQALIASEFGPSGNEGILSVSNSIFVSDSMLFTDPESREHTDPEFFRKLGRVFGNIFVDQDMLDQFDLVLVGASLPLSPHRGMDRIKRVEMQYISEAVLDALYAAAPALKNRFGQYFAATALPVRSTKSDQWVEFRLIPSEHVHKEMIRSLGKYYF